MNERFLFRWQRAICNAPNPATWKRGTPKPEPTPGQLASIAKHVALALAVYMDIHGKSAFPSLTELHDATGRSRKTIGRVLQELKAASFIRYTDRGREGKRGVTRHYEACLPDVLTSVPRTPVKQSSGVLPTSTSVLRTVNERSQNALPSQYQPNNNSEREKTTLPDDFELTPEMLEWAKRKLDPRIDVPRTTEKFIDYMRAEGRQSRDWSAAWRNWMRDERPPGNPGNGSSMSLAKANFWALKLNMIWRKDEDEDQFIARVKESLEQHGGTA